MSEATPAVLEFLKTIACIAFNATPHDSLLFLLRMSRFPRAIHILGILDLHTGGRWKFLGILLGILGRSLPTRRH